MKKLLALVLCVMMFVSVLSTSAFAEKNVVGPESSVPSLLPNGTYPKWGETYVAKKAVEKAAEAIEGMVGGIAADQGVFSTIKSIDSVVSSLSKGLFEGVDNATIFGTKYTNSQLEGNTKKYLRTHIGGEIMSYMKDHLDSYATLKTLTNPDGTTTTYTVYDPVKYMNAFATAASKAMSSEKAAKNIEALVYAVALAKTQKDVKDDMDDLYHDILDWQDGTDILGTYGFNSIVDPSVAAWNPLAMLDAQNVVLSSEVMNVISEWADPTTNPASSVTIP